jgi:hypothetical protein
MDYQRVRQHLHHRLLLYVNPLSARIALIVVYRLTCYQAFEAIMNIVLILHLETQV